MSESVRSAIQNSVSRKRVPAFNPGSIRDIALKLGVAFPVSLFGLLRTLSGLLPAGVTYDSGRFAAGNVHASATLYLQSDGGMLFSGQVHESGVVGDNFVLAMALLDVKDSSGKTLVFAHEDTIIGQLDIGFSDKEWHSPGFNQLVKDNWDAVKHTRVETRLHVSTDPFQLIETLFEGSVIAGGVVFGAIKLGEECSQGESWKCRPVVVGSQEGMGGDIVCRCEFN